MEREEREYERDEEEVPQPAGPTQTVSTDPPEVADPNYGDSENENDDDDDEES